MNTLGGTVIKEKMKIFRKSVGIYLLLSVSLELLSFILFLIYNYHIIGGLMVLTRR